MKRILFGLAIVMLGSVIASGAPKPGLFPVEEGNYWILESSLGDQKIIQCEPGTNKLLRVTGLSDRPVTFYASQKSPMLFRWSPARAVPLPFPTPAGGQIYRWQKAKIRRVVSLRPVKSGQITFSAGDHACDDLQIELSPVIGLVRTYVDEYTDCSALAIHTVDANSSACNLLSEAIYFAPGIGPVAIQAKLGRVYLLVEAKVGDTLIGGQ